jgi:hypothetical protein
VFVDLMTVLLSLTPDLVNAAVKNFCRADLPICGFAALPVR